MVGMLFLWYTLVEACLIEQCPDLYTVRFRHFGVLRSLDCGRVRSTSLWVALKVHPLASSCSRKLLTLFIQNG